MDLENCGYPPSSGKVLSLLDDRQSTEILYLSFRASQVYNI